MRRLSVLVLVALLALHGPVHAADAPDLPLVVEAGHSAVHMMGRFTDDHRFGWTACNARLRFSGTAANAVIELVRGRQSALQVVVDGEPTAVLMVEPGRHTYALAADLPPGEHVVEIWKRPEGFMGELRLVGFQVSADGVVLPQERPARRLLVIGDSITCGYGNEAAEIKEGNTVTNENGYLAYGPLAARKLGAEIMMVCWSGRGMFRNRTVENDHEGVLPQLYRQTLPLSADPAWDPAAWVPHVIVINLGTNDLARGPQQEKPELAKDDYLGAYRDFLQTLRAHYPEAHILVSIGPMALDPIRGWLPELAAEDERVHALVFEKRDGPAYFGGNWHPTVAMHRIMAETLVAKIREITGGAWD